MPTPEQLSAEKRCDIARAVTQQPWKYLYGTVILDGDKELSYWEPEKNVWQWQALVSTVAQMIEALPDWSAYKPEARVMLCKALADNNTPQIEGLAYELIEGGKDD